MARTPALSILEQGQSNKKIELREVSGYIIENLWKETLSSGLKNQNYTGDPASGSCEFKRIANSELKEYGTARTAQRGDAIKMKPIVVNLDQHKEIIEEAYRRDIEAVGVGNLMARRAENHLDSLASHIDRVFFKCAVDEGTKITTSQTKPRNMIEDGLLTLETLENEYITGIDRYMMRVICRPEFYSKIRDELVVTAKGNITTAQDEFGTLNGVRVYSSVYLPKTVDYVVMVVGSIALPIVMHPYSNPEQIPLSDDFAVKLFCNYGVKCLTPETVVVKMNP